MAHAFQTEVFYEEITARRNRKQLVEEVTEEVLSRLSATVDVSEIVDTIAELRKMIDDLGR